MLMMTPVLCSHLAGYRPASLPVSLIVRVRLPEPGAEPEATWASCRSLFAEPPERCAGGGSVVELFEPAACCETF